MFTLLNKAILFVTEYWPRKGNKRSLENANIIPSGINGKTGMASGGRSEEAVEGERSIPLS